MTDYAELVARLRAVYADWDATRVMPLLPAAVDAIDQLMRDKAAILDAAHAERDELRRTIERLTKELDEARYENDRLIDSRDEAVAQRERMAAQLADIERQVRERCSIICQGHAHLKYPHCSECMRVELGF